MTAPMTKKISEKEQNFLDEEIDIEFYNLEEPGLVLRFPFGGTKNYKTYTLFHGMRYKLPRKVVQHIESKGETIWKFTPDGRGSMTKAKQGVKSRFQCRQVFV